MCVLSLILTVSLITTTTTLLYVLPPFVSYDVVCLQSKRKELGDFHFEDVKKEIHMGQREVRKATILENGANYEGEWLVETQTRQGRGT